MSTSKCTDRLWPNGHTRNGHNSFVENVETANTKWGNESSFFSFVIFASLLLFGCCFRVFFSLSFHMSKVVSPVRPAPCFCQMLVWRGFRPPFCLSFLLSFAHSLSPLTDSSDKLSLSSAHMALGENQCPYVSSAALHWTDEG